MSARSTQIFFHNETNFSLTKIEEDLPHGEWGHNGDQRPPQSIDPHSVAEMGSDSSGVLTGTEGRVRYRIEEDKNWNQPFPIAQPNSAAVNTWITVVARTPDHLDVFWIGQDGGVGTNWWDANANNGQWNQPFPIAPPGAAAVGSGIAAVARSADHLDVFWVGPDGGVGTNWWDANANNGQWNQPFGIAPPGAAALGSGIAAVARNSNHLDVFWVGPDGGIGTNWWDGGLNNGHWNQPFPIAPPQASAFRSGIAAVARNPNHLDVFWIGPDGGVGTNWWDGGLNNGLWNQPFPIAPPHAAVIGSGIAAVARNPNHLDVFWTGPDGGVGTNWWDGGMNNGQWNQPFPIAPPHAAATESRISAVARTPNHLDVFWTGPDGGVGTNWWDGGLNNGLWNQPFPITAPGSASGATAIAAVARTADHLDVFWAGPDGGVGTNWWDGNRSTVYFHWDNPYSGTNKYHQFTDWNYYVFHTGGSGDNTVVDVFLRPSEYRDASGFRPHIHGYRFGNKWGDTPYSLPPLKDSILDYKYGNADNGLCGGMVYSVLDYFNAGLPVPPVNLPPPGEQDPLFNYIVERLFDSFDTDDVTLYLKLMDPAYPDTDENILNPVGLADGRAFVMANIEWPMIQQDIDAGHPSPMGLVAVKSLLPFDLGKNHQVLAYAYQVHGSEVQLWVYDPNNSLKDDISLKFNIHSTADRIDVVHNVDLDGRPIYCFFRTNYSFRQPPVILSQGNRQSSGNVVSRTPNHLDVFWIGPDGGVGTNWWDGGINNGQWNEPFPIAAPGAAAIGSGITAASRTPDHLDVFWIGPDGGVGSNWWDANANNGQWNQPFGIASPGAAALNSKIAAVARTPDHLDVFWIGPDGAVGSNWWDSNANNGQWNQPFPITQPGAAASGSGITVVARTPNHLDVFWIGPDGGVGSNWWDANANNGQWNQPFGIAPPGAAAPGSSITALARTPDHLDVFWVGPDGGVGTNWWDSNINGGAWNQHFPIAPPHAASPEAGIIAVTRSTDHLDVFWVGPDCGIGTNWWDAGVNNGQWNQPFPIAPPNAAITRSWTGAAARTLNHLDVFWIGPDGGVGTNWWDGSINNGAWNQPFPIAPPGAAVP